MYKSSQTSTNKAGAARQHTYGRFPIYTETGRRTSISIPAEVYDLLVSEVGIEKLKRLVMRFGKEAPVGERSKHVFRRIIEVLRESLESAKLKKLVNRIADEQS